MRPAGFWLQHQQLIENFDRLFMPEQGDEGIAQSFQGFCVRWKEFCCLPIGVYRLGMLTKGHVLEACSQQLICLMFF